MDNETTVVMALMGKIADRNARLATIKEELVGLRHEERAVPRLHVLGTTRRDAVCAVIATERAALRAERKRVTVERAQLQRAAEVLDRADAAALGAALKAQMETAAPADAETAEEVGAAA
ncbi:MAG: hypothetical protein JNK82_08105 [Myxococcaceae bacterium]|nr:hypothetical protein [Myxococcaceae bacterium]